MIVLVISEYDRIRELMAVLALDTETENEASSDSIAWSYEDRRLNVNNGSTFYFDELAFYVYYLEMSKGIDDLFTE